MFPALADALAALEVGDGRIFVDLATQMSDDPFLCDTQQGQDGDSAPEMPESEGSHDGGIATLCSDGERMNDTADEFGEYVDELVALSKSAGATMANMRLACVQWSIEVKWRFAGRHAKMI
jgi:hypothetical protein